MAECDYLSVHLEHVYDVTAAACMYTLFIYLYITDYLSVCIE